MAARSKKKAPRNTTPKKGPAWERAFLAALAETGNVTLSSTAAGIAPTTAYDRRRADAGFAGEWAAALDAAADGLEAEARRRAADGVRRVKFWQGMPVMVPAIGADGLPVRNVRGHEVMVPYVEHEYSDTLLIFLLKAARPEKFRDNVKHEHTGQVAQVHVYMPSNGRADAPAAT